MVVLEQARLASSFAGLFVLMVGNAVCTAFPDGTRYILYRPFGSFKDGDDVLRVPPLPSLVPSLRSKTVSIKRTVNHVFELARSNVWDWFCTLTIDSSFCDRYSYADCSSLLRHYTRHLQYVGSSWLIVPDQHNGDTYLKRGLPIPPDYRPGAYHFHGLLRGSVSVGSPVPGRPDLCTLPDWPYGNASVSFIQSQARVSSYISRYLTKDGLTIPKGKKRYWCSRDLSRPVRTLFQLSDADACSLAVSAVYCKHISNVYGDFDFFECPPSK